jgi:hypothetical protein
MRGPAWIRKWALAAGAAVFAALLHVHAPLALSSGPVLVASDGDECPVCATVGGGMEAPPAPVLLPAASGPARPLPVPLVAALLEAPGTPSPARAPPPPALA